MPSTGSLTVVEPIAAECARWWTQRDGRGGRRILAESSMASRVAPAALTVAGYAREGGTLDSARIDSMLKTLDSSLADGTYLTVVPQFLVTSTR